MTEALNGPHRLELGINDDVRRHLRDVVLGKIHPDAPFLPDDQVIVEENKDTFWRTFAGSKHPSALTSGFASNSISLTELGMRKEDIEKYEATHCPSQQSENLRETERDSLLKIILGMAIAKYGYNPLTKRNPVTGENAGSIHYDLDRYGCSVDVDTIRKHLKDAVDKFYTT